MPATSLPASASERQYDAWHSPDATRVTYFCFNASEPWSSTGVIPSFEMNVNNDDDAQTRATSSTASACARKPPSWPPYCDGNARPANPPSRQASQLFQGYSSFSSAAAAFGAMCVS